MDNYDVAIIGGGQAGIPLAYALTDSPIGLAAWIAEKFHGWSAPGPDGPPFTMEQILTDVMIYWLTGSANTASWLYTAARRLAGMRLGRGEFVGVPTAFVSCPHDLFPAPPDRWVQRVYHCVRRTDLPVGGHFLAYERPAEFVRADPVLAVCRKPHRRIPRRRP